MAHTVSPLKPELPPHMPEVPGVTLSTTATGMRYKGRDDALLMRFEQGTQVAGVFTKNRMAASPVHWCRQVAEKGNASALIVNAGNANACTGAAGDAALRAVVDAVARMQDVSPDTVLMASTGVIGQVLPAAPLRDALPGLAKDLAASGWEKAAHAIMTTDTFAKYATRSVRIGDAKITINGIAKGSGMIAPDMATMLGFIATDAHIPHAILTQWLRESADRSFNAITVDGDTSTNDTVLLFATGAAGNAPPKAADDAAFQTFREALSALMTELAHAVVRDGEGAQKFVAVRVSGAENDASARRIGLAIANSPLVKTAIAGEDANWGRIAMAVGKSGESFAPEALSIAIGGVAICQGGAVVAGYDETPVAAHMRGSEIAIAVSVGAGKGQADVWTTDLTHGYIDINGAYRS